MSTRAESLRTLVAEFFADDVEPAEIAKRVGISVDRVEAILDQLDETDGRPTHPDDEHRAPAVEPVHPDPRPVAGSGPIVVGSPARAPSQPKPAVVRPVPDWITAIVEGLKKHPGRWAAVQRGQRTSSGATTWKKRGCEAVSRREETAVGEPVTWTVYARWPA